MLRRSARNAGKTTETPQEHSSRKRSSSSATSQAAKKAKAAVKNIARAAGADVETEKPQESQAVNQLQEGDVLPDDLPGIQTHAGDDTSVAALVAASKKGIIIFAYPKASTPGCTKQACHFRDNFQTFEDSGYTVFGLSGDGPSANEKFKTKQNLPYTLLCDPKYELHEKLGIKKHPKGTIRGVIIIENGASGAKILRKTPASPDASLKIAQEVIGGASELEKTDEKKDEENGTGEAVEKP